MQNPETNPSKQFNIYNCAACNYNVRNRKDFKKHLETNKHNKNVMAYNLTQTIGPTINPVVSTSVGTIVGTSVGDTSVKPYLCKCGKTYTGRGGLWNHKKICNVQDKCSNSSIDQKFSEAIKETIINNARLLKIEDTKKEKK